MLISTAIVSVLLHAASATDCTSTSDIVSAADCNINCNRKTAYCPSECVCSSKLPASTGSLLWNGGFEVGDVSEYNSLSAASAEYFAPEQMNERGDATPSAPRCGYRAAKITIGEGESYRMGWGENRVMAVRNVPTQVEGASSFFAFSFAADSLVKPMAKSSGMRQVLTFEADLTYHEMASLRVSQDGTMWQFVTVENAGDPSIIGNEKVQWEAPLAAGMWSDFIVEVKWSTVESGAEAGRYSFTHNGGTPVVVEAATLQTPCMAGVAPNPVYMMLGARRLDGSDTGDEVYWFDCFREATSRATLGDSSTGAEGTADLPSAGDLNECTVDTISGYQRWEGQVKGCGTTIWEGGKVTADWTMGDDASKDYGTINVPINGLYYAVSDAPVGDLTVDISTSTTLSVTYTSDYDSIVQLRIKKDVAYSGYQGDNAIYGGHHFYHNLSAHPDSETEVLQLADFVQKDNYIGTEYELDSLDLTQAYSFTFAIIAHDLELEITAIELDGYTPPCTGQAPGTVVGDMVSSSASATGFLPGGFGPSVCAKLLEESQSVRFAGNPCTDNDKVAPIAEGGCMCGWSPTDEMVMCAQGNYCYGSEAMPQTKSCEQNPSGLRLRSTSSGADPRVGQTLSVITFVFGLIVGGAIYKLMSVIQAKEQLELKETGSRA